jgi:L-glyceraldehyde 3-phosphate reductase
MPPDITSDPPYAPATDRHAHLPYRRAGRSGLDLPSLSLGLWQNFGHDNVFSRQREIILRAIDLGICHFDNADRYGPPHREAQRVFGRVMRRDLRGMRDELVLSTKAGNPVGPSPYHRGGSRKRLLTSLDESLRDLGTDHVDVFYHHRADLMTPLEETVGALVAAVHQGKALYVGISNYEPARAREASRLLTGSGTPLLVHQTRYSMLARDAEDELLEVAESDGVGVVAYSPLAQGLLTGKYADTVPAGSRADNSSTLPLTTLDDAYRTRVRALSSFARARGESLTQLALQWVLRNPVVTSALIGVSSAEQLEHNVAATRMPPLTAVEIAALDELLATDSD